MLREERSVAFCTMRVAVAALVGLLLGNDGPGFSQALPPTAPTPSQSTAAPPTEPRNTPVSQALAAAAPTKETKETKESKETKEIKDRPSDWVEFAGVIAWPLCVLLIAFMLLFSRAAKRALGLLPKV